MKSIYDYDFLQNEVFYRSEHILRYLERHHDLTDLDKEALGNTILDALVTKGLIDPERQSLDMDSLSIKDDLEHIVYSKTPNVTSIPLSLKEEMRKRCLVISASIPVSIFCAKPASRVQTCIYDMNTALSSFFPSFSFLICNYDSPTRPGMKASGRPFLSAEVGGEEYLFDLLTKRIFKRSYFSQRYNMELIEEVKSEDFTKEQGAFYKEQTMPQQNLATYLSLVEPLLPGLKGPKQEEMMYEFEQSKVYFPEAYVELEILKAEMQAMDFILPKQ